jgi:hypothetical protein
MFIEYIIFGIVDNLVMILGAFTGIEVEKYLPKRFQLGALMPIAGAGIGNSVSDTLGGLASLNLSLAFGTGLGCLIGLLAIPMFCYLRPTTK